MRDGSPGLNDAEMLTKHRHWERESSQSKSPTLASLEYLQTQRRGSITDHFFGGGAPGGSRPAHHGTSGLKLNPPFPPLAAEQPDSASSDLSAGQHDGGSRGHTSDPRPASSYRFGDATTDLRKIVNSPSSEHISSRPASNVSESQGSGRNISVSFGSKETSSNHMNERLDPLNRRNRETFDYGMRRHSIAVGANVSHPPHISATHGIKRKMSADRSMFAPVREDMDSHLVGPGVPSVMEVDTDDAPAPKRRVSTIASGMNQISLEDRRNSTAWNPDERRDSATSLFSQPHHPSPFLPSVYASDSSNSRLPPSMANFSWTNPPDSLNLPPVNGNGKDYAPNGRVADVGPIPPLHFPNDRRMSVPDLNRSHHSRPPSRQDTSSSSHSISGAATLDDSLNVPNSKAPGKDSSTPYSRSPELRVSHKLAERKRRKEMKELFDDLRDHLPSDRGMKASKWEILTKAIEYVAHLKNAHQSMQAEIDELRRENESLRQGGMPGFGAPGGPPHPMAYSQTAPPMLPPQFSPPPSSTHPLPHHPQSASLNQIITQNGHNRAEGAPLPQS